MLARLRELAEFTLVVRQDRGWVPAERVDTAVADLPGHLGRFTNALDWSAGPWWSWAGLKSDPYATPT